jgi:hypothetical protein
MPLPRMLALLLAVSPIAGCAESKIPTPLTTDTLIEVLEPVPNYRKAPCWMQQAWARDNARKATLKSGKPVYYKAPCDLRPQTKTS